MALHGRHRRETADKGKKNIRQSLNFYYNRREEQNEEQQTINFGYLAPHIHKFTTCPDPDFWRTNGFDRSRLRVTVKYDTDTTSGDIGW